MGNPNGFTSPALLQEVQAGKKDSEKGPGLRAATYTAIPILLAAQKEGSIMLPSGDLDLHGEVV